MNKTQELENIVSEDYRKDIPSLNFSVRGVNFGLHAKKTKHTGIQIGGISDIEDYIKGVQISLFGNGTKDIYGLQITSLLNICGILKGLQISALNSILADDVANEYGKMIKFIGSQIGFINSIGKDCAYSSKKGICGKGIQIGAFNRAEDNYSGAQIGCLNGTEELGGCQIGIYNSSIKTKGIQSGVVNITKKILKGVQIGLVCYTKKGNGHQFGLINISGEGPWYKKKISFFYNRIKDKKGK